MVVFMSHLRCACTVRSGCSESVRRVLNRDSIQRLMPRESIMDASRQVMQLQDSTGPDMMSSRA